MRERIYRFFIISICVCISLQFSLARDKWRTNIFESSVSNVALDVTSGSQEERNQRIQQALRGKERWCDAFIKQHPGKLKGVFTFKGKQRVVGIGYDVSSAKARKQANKNNLAAFDEAGLNKFGVYATVLKIRTQNGYYVFAILRSPVSEGLMFEDFQDKSDDILEGIDTEG